MKKYKESHHDNLNTHTAINNCGKTIVHPTLMEYRMFEIHQQLDVLLEQLDIVARQRADSNRLWREQLAKESPITMNISLTYEELSLFYESIGKPAEALDALVMAGQSLFLKHCAYLNSLMGRGEPHEARLYLLDERCRELCERHPELWDAYRNSNMHYLIEEQHLWPCE